MTSQHIGVKNIGVIGAGLMGHGIAQAFAVAGHRVDIQEPDPDLRTTIVDRVRRNLRELGQDDVAADAIHPCETIEEAVARADVVIEAVPENLDLKQRVFAAIEAAAPAHALLASNTSVIPITRIMEPLRDKTRAMGTHWWNPPHLIPLVEVIRTAETGDAAIAAMTALLASIGKLPVQVRKDVPGFIGNRLQHALWREAIALVQDGVCDAETLDTVVKAGFGRRLAVLGPLENADLVGTDLTLAVHEHVLPDLDRTPGPLPLLRELVASGRLGMKAGAGFRTWTPAQRAEVHNRLALHLQRLDGAERG
ncbi:3-hydroxyacyl-CoA dehydrogenase family protein [Azospirillum sp.]|uniref:3-hydroxyacyl-CoA dehydrogenase family protein n=1 Tax=Azospirillum sp. TaxID=34012 RepID=UPI002D324B93|nr:3-hydroxyacyl-CoA dehydrogenase NAD-binding domain-containing protein [Azospirillum sp.]HYD65280.1 3-hydroxyacyl-CoA dehydrogenase NAD-binding domain-containing protein [Azospirillum sp.]